jgi:hypothetical protein
MTVNSWLYTLHIIGMLTGDIQEDTEFKKKTDIHFNQIL